MKPLARRLVVGAAVGAVLLGTLALYQQPGFMMNLADQLWSCF